MNVSRELLLIAKDILGSYPDTPPSEKDRKKWREKAEEIRRHEGIKPRKAGDIQFSVGSTNASYIVIGALKYKDTTETFEQAKVAIQRKIKPLIVKLNSELERLGLSVSGWDVDGYTNLGGVSTWNVNVNIFLRPIPIDMSKLRQTAIRIFE